MSQHEDLGGKIPGSGDSVSKVFVLGKNTAGATIYRKMSREEDSRAFKEILVHINLDSDLTDALSIVKILTSFRKHLNVTYKIIKYNTKYTKVSIEEILVK